ASGFLARLAEGAQVPVYVEPNERFRVPADASRDIIMIGPGTGVAPFRGFVQERAETGASGRNWLFFGAQHFNTGFLYQAEWQEALQRKELHRLDLAFSRDQPAKVYVQDRLRERRSEEHTSELQSRENLVCRLLLEKKKNSRIRNTLRKTQNNHVIR